MRRWLLSWFSAPPTLTEQMRALWGKERTARVIYAEADPLMVRLQKRRALLRKAS